MPLLLLAGKLLHDGHTQMRLYAVRYQLLPFLLMGPVVRLVAGVWRRLAMWRMVRAALS